MKTNCRFFFRLISIFLITFFISYPAHAQRLSGPPTIHIDKKINTLCFGVPYTLSLTYTNADGVLWWMDPSSDGNIIGSATSTTIGYNPGPGDLSKEYFILHAMTIQPDTTYQPAFDSILVRISPMPYPEFYIDTIIAGNPVEVHFKDSSRISSSGSISVWNWNFGNSCTSTDQNPKAFYYSVGSYDVSLKVISSGGCINTLVKTHYILINDSNLGIQDHSGKEIETLYPNPATTNVYLPENPDLQSLSVSNIQGKVVLQTNYQGIKTNMFDVSDLKPGMYFVSLKLKNGSSKSFKISIR